MGNIVASDQTSTRPNQKRTKIIVLLVVIALIGATIIVLVGTNGSKDTPPTWYYPELALKAGASLNYTVAGYNVSGSFDTYGEFSFQSIDHNQSSNGAGFMMNTPVSELNATNWGPMLFGPGASMCYGKDTINASFGTKYVDKYIAWSGDAILISYIGSRSGIGYRLVVAGQSFGMNVTLAAASVEALEGLDTSPSGVDRTLIVDNPTQWMPVPADEGPEVTLYQETRGGTEFGLFKFDKLVHINFRQMANGSAVFFFTASKIAEMEGRPYLTYSPDLSIPTGNGSIDYTGVPGLVFYVKDTVHMEERTGLKYEMIWYP